MYYHFRLSAVHCGPGSAGKAEQCEKLPYTMKRKNTMTITLTPEIERVLTARASRQGTTPEQMALHDLTELYAEAETDKPDPFEGKTLADVLAGHIGTIRSSEYTGIEVSHLSEDEDSFTDYLVEKRQQGRL